MITIQPEDHLHRVVSRIAQVLYAISRNSAATLGLIVAILGGMFASHPDLLVQAERRAAVWLAERHSSAVAKGERDDDGILAGASSAEAAERATAVHPGDLPRQQAQVAHWLSKKYRVAPEPVSALVAEAFELGNRIRIDPTLLLAVMAVESGFNPFAQSHMGAQGLMQVMTRVHTDKYQNFGGTLAAFDPVSNLRVGAMVLRDCIARAGSVEAGLKRYVGAANTGEDGGYAAKVLAEQQRLLDVATKALRAASRQS